jgi:enoyl-[acyl-carrier-protein] reductase (NADH)
MVHTGFVPGRSEEMMLRTAMASPMKRQIEAHDVALAVLSCVTHLKFTTGSIVNVNGGAHL